MSYPDTIKPLYLAIGLAVFSLLLWEWHWRSEGYQVGPDDDKHLWSENRAKVEKLDSNGVVLLGSSRVFFDIQLDEWESLSNNKPIMLAAAGTSPIPVFIDIVENTDFNGTIVLGVTPPLYFSPPGDDTYFWGRVARWIKHYHSRTYAERFNHFVSKAPQNSFAFLNSTEEIFYNELDLRTLLQTFDNSHRIHSPPPFASFSNIDKDRNVTMWRAHEDTAYARSITDFWTFVIQPPPETLPPPEVMEELRQTLTGMTADYVEQFEDRGGQIILVRFPSQALFRAVENGGFPREKFWDPLVEAAGCPAYHFEDYDFMNAYQLPEWSHLATADAREFTTNFVGQLIKDNLLR